MKRSKKSNLFYLSAIIVAGLGIWFMWLFINSQNLIITRGLAQGATKEAIQEFLWNQAIPEGLMNLITIIGFTTVITGLGYVVSKLDTKVEDIEIAVSDDSIDLERYLVETPVVDESFDEFIEVDEVSADIIEEEIVTHDDTSEVL